MTLMAFIKNNSPSTTRRSEYLGETSGIVREAVFRTALTMIVETPFQSAFDAGDSEVLHFMYVLLFVHLHFTKCMCTLKELAGNSMRAPWRQERTHHFYRQGQQIAECVSASFFAYAHLIFNLALAGS